LGRLVQSYKKKKGGR